jgi:hypothetical protein
MKALGLWQPYAGLIRCGIKTIETRFWPTSYRGPLLICSTNRKMNITDHQVIAHYNDSRLSTDAFSFNLGVMQCVVDVVDCRLGTKDDERAACCELYALNPRTGIEQQKYAFILENVRLVDEKPVKCGRKWFDVLDELVVEV